jgi:hypothetical protein
MILGTGTPEDRERVLQTWVRALSRRDGVTYVLRPRDPEPAPAAPTRTENAGEAGESAGGSQEPKVV